MRYTGAALALLLLFACVAEGIADSPAAGAGTIDIEEVIVTGEQPGPRLWKVTRGERSLWVFGTVTPKPRDITWRSKEVARVLDETQEVINQQLQGTAWAAEIRLHLDSRNPFRRIGAERAVSRIRDKYRPPPLVQSVPPELYARFLTLKDRYPNLNTSIEHERPRVAAALLYNAAIDATRLTMRAMIHEEVHRLAARRDIKVSQVVLDIKVDLDTLLTIYTELEQTPVAEDLACFEETIGQIESELPTIVARANAWAIGDVAALRQLPSLRREACDRARWNAPRWADLEARLETLWLDSVDAAIARNQTTLILVDMAEILEPDGLLASLSRRGYVVHSPEEQARP